MQVRIGRLQNTYGPQGAWSGGREKAPAATCRKVAEAPDGGRIEVWGNGSAIRSYVYVSDRVDAIYLPMQSDLEGPVNIGFRSTSAWTTWSQPSSRCRVRGSP